VWSAAILGLGVAAAGTVLAPVAQAQDTRVPASAAAQTRATTPWYEQFSFGQSRSTMDSQRWNGSQVRAQVRVAPTEQSRWAVQVDVRDRDRTQLRSQESVAAGAYFSFTPRVQVGGQVTFASPPNQDFSRRAPEEGGEAGVRIQSAIRF